MDWNLFWLRFWKVWSTYPNLHFHCGNRFVFRLLDKSKPIDWLSPDIFILLGIGLIKIWTEAVKLMWQQKFRDVSSNLNQGTGERQMSLQSSKRARRKTQGTTGWSASPPSQERWWSSLSWRSSSSKWKKRRLSGVVSMDSPRGNHAWPVWEISTMAWLAG